MSRARPVSRARHSIKTRRESFLATAAKAFFICCGCATTTRPVFIRKPKSGLFDIVDFAAKAGDAPAARAATAAADGGSVRIDWGDDGESVFAADFLRAHAYDAQSLAERAERPTLWDSESLPQPPRFDCAQIFADKAARLRWLRALADFGIALVENTPDRDGAVCDLARLIAPLRRTNFGEDFVVESKPDPNNIAYTAHALQLHTDLPNRESPPGAQFLHCRRNEATGGESIFADGFAAAAELRRRSEDDFLLLARAPLPFRFHDRDNDLRHRAPTIGLDARRRGLRDSLSRRAHRAPRCAVRENRGDLRGVASLRADFARGAHADSLPAWSGRNRRVSQSPRVARALRFRSGERLSPPRWLLCRLGRDAKPNPRFAPRIGANRASGFFNPAPASSSSRSFFRAAARFPIRAIAPRRRATARRSANIARAAFSETR